jgi:hypothetical protein
LLLGCRSGAQPTQDCDCVKCDTHRTPQICGGHQLIP